MKQFDVSATLASLGVWFTESAGEGCGYCPMHAERTGKEDHNPSWFINLDSGMHTCFSCGYKGNLVQLVCDVKGFYIESWGDIKEYDYAAGNAWLAEVAEISLETLAEIMKSLPIYIPRARNVLEMSEARLAIFVEPPVEAMEGRRINSEAVEAYGVQWHADTARWILPLREPHFNKLMGWQEKGTIDRTFKNRPTGLQKSKTLFGLNTQREDLVVVVESPLDCLRIHTAGFPGAVAICGSSPSEEQIKLLRYSNKIVIALDNDNAGFKGSSEFLKYGRKYGLNLFFFNYSGIDKKDPGDMTDEEIAWGIEHSKSSILGESAYVSRDTQALPN